MRLWPLQNARVYLKTPNAPGQRAFLRCAASFFLEIRQYSCEKMSCATQKSLAAGHIMSFQIHPRSERSWQGAELRSARWAAANSPRISEKSRAFCGRTESSACLTAANSPKIFAKSGTLCRADVGIGPYKMCAPKVSARPRRSCPSGDTSGTVCF